VDHPAITQQENLARGALINLVGKLVGRAIHIGTQIILARWLGLALFGFYAIGWNLLRVGTSILPLGIDIALLQIGPKWWLNEPKKVSRLFQIAGLAILVISLTAGLFLFLASDWISSLYSKPELSLVMRVLALALPFALLLRVGAYATRVTQKMQFGIISEEIIQPVSNLGIALVLLQIGGGLGGALWATNISFGLALAYTIFVVVKIFPAVWTTRIRFDKEIIQELWSASAPLAGAAFFATLILLVDRLMVGFLLSEVEAGLYQAASIFAVFFVTVLSAFKTIIAPLVAESFNRGDTQAVEESY
jgi:O-antigen/teichoic acid export membrane protein